MEEEETEVKKSSGTGLKIAIIVLTVMLVIGGTVAGLYFGGVFGGGAAESDSEADPDAAEQPVKQAAVYVPLEPPFVVNFQNTDKAKFLQLSMEVMTRDPTIPALIDMHKPAIRNNLMLLFSNQQYEKISTLAGKETLREEALTVIQEVLEEETGSPGVEAVYFTSIVMQ